MEIIVPSVNNLSINVNDDVKIDVNMYPNFNFKNQSWNLAQFNSQLAADEVDDFMPCGYMFFVEDHTQIGIVVGNVDKDHMVLEYIEVNGCQCGYGRKILNKISSLGVKKIHGYSIESAIGFWEAMGAEFTGRLMFERYPIFELELGRMD